ncbi:MAG: BMP family ABC transporter substrate-binding protein [Thermoleophilia bacterium]|nr:BMP family ABC transporter substrate-binding protein [Thermoleophilia bacterium]
MARRERSTGSKALALMLTLLLMTVGLALIGCGEDGETTTTAVAEETTESTAPPETESTEPAPSGITKMAVTAPEEATDYGWNQQGVESAEKVAAEIDAEIIVQDGAGYEDITPILRDLAEEGSQLTIAFASGYGTAAVQQAEELQVPHVIIGQFEQGLIPGLAQDVETYAQHGSYLAGIAAAKTSKTGTLGIVISADDENWIKMAAGFALGAQSVNPDIKVLMAQIGQAGYADAAGGKRVTESVIAGGADVIFGMGDGSSFGMIQAVETATPPSGADKVWFIDVIGDKTSLDKKGVLLTSVVWDYAPAFKAAADALAAGTFGNEIIWLDIDNGGIDLLKTQYLSDDVWADVETARQGIIDGSITIPEIQSKAEVEAMIK